MQHSRFNGFSSQDVGRTAKKPLKRFSILHDLDTRLKPGANEISQFVSHSAFAWRLDWVGKPFSLSNAPACPMV
jgi:hypothetical protein